MRYLQNCDKILNAVDSSSYCISRDHGDLYSSSVSNRRGIGIEGGCAHFLIFIEARGGAHLYKINGQFHVPPVTFDFIDPRPRVGMAVSRGSSDRAGNISISWITSVGIAQKRLLFIGVVCFNGLY